MHEIIIPGKPIAKNRPRFAVKTKGKKGSPEERRFVQTYFDQETEEGRVMNFIRAAFASNPLDGPLTLEAEFYFSPPASASKKRRAAMLSGEEPCTNPKDVDNLLKFIMDASNGILWHDDRQVVRLSGFKAYGERDQTVLRLCPARFALAIPKPLSDLTDYPFTARPAETADAF